MTDNRVVYQQAPFDVPEIHIPVGHLESAPGVVVDDGTGNAVDVFVTIGETGAMKNNIPGFEFDLGIVFGPRAFPAHAFTGNRMAWGTLEQRVFLIDELFGFMGLGFAGFLDYGGAWYDTEAARAGGNVGVGIRFGGTRGTAANVGRLDLSWRFGEGCVPASEGSCEGNRWAISFGRAFPF